MVQGSVAGNRPTGLGQQVPRACRPKRLGLPVRQQARTIRTRRAHRTPCLNPRRAPSRTPRHRAQPDEGRPLWHLTAGAGPVPGGIPVSVSRRLQDIRTGAVHVGWHEPRHNFCDQALPLTDVILSEAASRSGSPQRAGLRVVARLPAAESKEPYSLNGQRPPTVFWAGS